MPPEGGLSRNIWVSFHSNSIEDGDGFFAKIPVSISTIIAVV